MKRQNKSTQQKVENYSTPIEKKLNPATGHQPKKTCWTDLGKAKEKIKALKADCHRVRNELWALENSKVFPKGSEHDAAYWKNIASLWQEIASQWKSKSGDWQKAYYEIKESDDMQGEEWKEKLKDENEDLDYDYSDCKITDIKRFKKQKHLICINPGGPDEDTGLEFLERYIANGTCIMEGDPCYYIVNWKGSGKERIKKISRFIIPKNPPKN